jgi:hypothetical protein
MASKKVPSGSHLNELFAAEACSMEKIAIIDQLRPLNIDYKIIHDRKRNEIMIEIPTSIDGIIRISAYQKGATKNRRFFRFAPPKEMRLPGGKVIRSSAKERVHAEVDFISHGEHENATYIIDETDFAEVIDTAIECLAQIDSVYLSTLPKKRPQRREKANKPEPGAN